MRNTFPRRLAMLPLFLGLMLFSLSCKKDSDPEPVSVIGTWEGKYSTNITTVPSIVWDPMVLKEGGILEGSDRVGTYNVTGKVLTATYVRGGATFSFRCDIKENFTELNGTWGTGPNQNNGGTLLLSKQ